MSGHCCHEKKFEGVSAQYKRALVMVIVINAVMFVVEMLAGISAQSQSLKADALDFFGDALTYSLSLWVIGHAAMTRARVAMFKGISLGIIGVWVLVSTVYQTLILDVPTHETMASIGVLALVANLLSMIILMKYRDGDANVRSVWLCTRNDAIGNVVVVIAAFGVWGTGTAWPDLIVAGIMAVLFVSSAVQIIRQSLNEMACAREAQAESH